MEIQFSTLVRQICREFSPKVMSAHELADKHRSVAGYYFESLFFKHCQEKNRLFVSCVGLKEDE